VRIEGNQFSCDICGGSLVVAMDGRYLREEAMQAIRCSNLCTATTVVTVLCPRCKQPINGGRLAARWRLPIPVVSWAVDLVFAVLFLAGIVGTLGLVLVIDKVFHDFRKSPPYTTSLNNLRLMCTPSYTTTLHFCPPSQRSFYFNRELKP
jgi:hypothetical protein